MRTAILLLFTFVSFRVDAQTPALAQGMRVHVWSNDLPSGLRGSVLARTPDLLLVARPGLAVASIPTSSIRRLRVSSGKTRRAGAVKGAKIGAWVGGIAGAFIGMAVSDGSTEDLAPLFLAALFGTGTALWGAGIGATVRAEKWTTVYVRVPAGAAIIRE